MAITTTLPTLNFVSRGSLVRDEYVAHQDAQFAILSGEWSTNMEAIRIQINSTEENINARESTVSTLSAQVQSNANVVSGMTAQVLKAYNDTLALINSYVIPTEVTYSKAEIDKKIADGVLLYGLAYGFGETKEVKSDKQLFDEQMLQNFKINYAQGY